MKKISKFFALLMAVCCFTATFSACAEDGYKLTVQDPERLIIGRLNDRYSEGEKITVKTQLLLDAVVIVYLDDIELDNGTLIQSDGVYVCTEYYLIMPSHDAVLKVETRDGFF